MATIKSIEQKAKRYDEAIEKLRNFYRDYDTVSRLIDVKEELANLIPELKESEDWIPKEIIKYLKEKGGFRSCWIDWLEKQGEQKPTIEMITPEESLGVDSDTYNKIVDECIYGEQKLTDKVNSNLLTVERAKEISPFMKTVFENEPTDKVAPRQEELTEFEKAVKQVMEEAIECGDTHNLKADADMLLRLVQKPAWSEEDDTFFKAIIRDIENTQYISEDAKKDRINWLKSLKDRIQPQVNVRKLIEKLEWLENTKTTIWSMDDEAMFSKMIIEGVSPEVSDWVKSFKNRVQPKQEWSGEDAYNHHIILALLNNECVGRADKRIAIEWFKSIKERVGCEADCTTTKEWSEEDMAMYQGVIETEQYMLDVVYGRRIFDVGNEGIKEECAEELAWLNSRFKKLLEQFK